MVAHHVAAAPLRRHVPQPVKYALDVSHAPNNQNPNKPTNLYRIGSSFEIENVLDSVCNSCYTLPNMRAGTRSVGLRSLAGMFDKARGLRYNSALEQAFPQSPGLPRAVEHSYASVHSIRNCPRDYGTGW